MNVTVPGVRILRRAGLISPPFSVEKVGTLTLSLSAGVLENQVTLGGGGSIWPPLPLNPMFDVQIWQMIHEKPWTMPFQICKKFCKILNNLIFDQEKLKMCKFPLTGCLQKICNFFRKTCAIRSLMSKAFQKAKFYQNLTSGSGSKQRFSLLQEKAVIQAVCLRNQAVSIKVRF